MFIDAHCHLSQLSEDELQGVLTRAKDAGVEKLVAIGAGYGFQDNPKTLDIAKKHDNIFCALAMHPHDAAEVTDENFAQLKNWIQTEPKVKAVGEIGLDYHYMNSPKDKQQEVLHKFSALALEVKKPIVIHDRDCDFDCYDILQSENATKNGSVVHCFTGPMPLAKKYLDAGYFLSFTGIITFKKAADLREVVKYCPLDRMMIETDSPFLAPVPHRGKQNEPAYVKHVAECVAELKGLSVAEIAQTTKSTIENFFDL